MKSLLAWSSIHYGTGPAPGAHHRWYKSAFTVEDLHSDWLGAQFGEFLRNKPYTSVAPEFEKLLKSWQPVPLTPIWTIFLKKEAAMLRNTNKKMYTVFPTPYLGTFNEEMKRMVGNMYWK